MARKRNRRNDALGKCVIEDCQNDAFYVNSGLCKACYAAMYYWKRRSVTEMVRYMQKLKFREGRMSRLVGKNVSPMMRGGRRARGQGR